MTDTSANPVTTPKITWQDIKPKLPLIQNNKSTVPVAPPFFRTFGVEFDQEKGEWTVVNSAFGFIGVIPDLSSNDVHVIEESLRNFLFKYYQGLLRGAVDASVHNIILTVAKQIPYPQSCQCQNYPQGQALDCHEHMENPCHFFGDLRFFCTCDEQNTTR